MFRERIRKEDTKITNASQDMFPGIITQDYNGDYTIVAMLRGLIDKRISEEEKFTQEFVSCSYELDESEINIGDVADFNHGLKIISLTSRNDDSRDKARELIKITMEENGYELVEKVSIFFKSAFPVECYIDELNKASIVVVDRLDTRRLHCVLCGLIAYLPWYFKDVPATEDEISLIKTMNEKSSDAFLNAIKKIEVNYDFESARIRELLSGLEQEFQRSKIRSLKDRDENLKYDIDNIRRRISEKIAELKEVQMNLLALQLAEANTEEENGIMNYFLNNKSVRLIEREGTRLKFISYGYLMFWDEDTTQRILDNKTSIFRNGDGKYGSEYDDTLLKDCLERVFIDREIKIRMMAEYRLDINSGVDGIQNPSYPSDMKDYTPNPHVDRYACLSGNADECYRHVQNGNYTAAIDQCTSSALGINVADGIVMREFMDRLTGCRNCFSVKCFELPDGKVVTLKEAMEWCKEHEREEE